MKKIWIILLFSFLQVAPAAAQQNGSRAVDEVVAAERNFAATAAARGLKTAFLENAADSAIVFGARPVNAKKLWERIPESDALLAWQPVWADVSASGQMGYTTGPFAFSADRSSAPGSFGEYVTIWKKQPDGAWKFVIDIGVRHKKTTFRETAELVIARQGAKKRGKEASWIELENDLVDFLKRSTTAKAYRKFAAPEIRFLREVSLIDGGQNPADDTGSKQNTKLALTPLGGEATADLAYAYGEYQLTDPAKKAEKGFYLHIWKRENKGWRVVLDLQQALPEPPKSTTN